jgi:hypothetical protein
MPLASGVGGMPAGIDAIFVINQAIMWNGI